MAYRNDPMGTDDGRSAPYGADRPGAPYPPAGYPPPGPPPGNDNRPLIIAGVVALVVLVAVVSYYLLVYVPARDARLAEAPPEAPVAVDERPPGALSEGDAFQPSVIETPAPPPVDDAPGLEGPPRRAPRPDGSAAQPPPARAEHVAFAEEYLARAGASAEKIIGLYDAPVRYYALGRVDEQTVLDDKLAYDARFPDRRYALAGPVRVVSSSGSDTATLRFDYTFAVGGGPGGDRSGRAWVELDVVRVDGSYLIQGERGDVY